MSLILCAILAAVALGGMYAVDLSRQKVGAEKQLAKDTVVFNACVKDRDAAVTANASLQNDIEKYRVLVVEQNKAMDKMVDVSKAMRTAQVKGAIQAQDKIKALSLEKIDLDAALRDRGDSGTCDQRLARVSAMLREAMRQQARDHPEKAARDVLGLPPKDAVTIRPPR